MTPSKRTADPRRAQAALPKGATFNSPSAQVLSGDPQLDVRRLPSRAPTSPKRLLELLDGVDGQLNALNLDDQSVAAERLPNPAFIVKAQKVPRPSQERPNDAARTHPKADRIATRSTSDHSHDSDSGIGSSVSAESAPSSPEIDHRTLPGNAFSAPHVTTCTNVNRVIREAHKYTKSVFTQVKPSNCQSSNKLGRVATDTIERHLINPLLQQPRLQSFHPLVKGILPGIETGILSCLRDVEKYLVLSAPVSASFDSSELNLMAHTFGELKKRAATPASYLIFTETAIQCVYKTKQHLAGRDLCRPTDKPYTNAYFVNLIEQIRQYARIMEAHRLTRIHGKAKTKTVDVELNESGLNSLGETIRLAGGISADGTPLRLVREKANGEILDIDVEQQQVPEAEEADGERSMARKRKCDIGKETIRYCRECDKQFTRMCDLTKHEKTHTRPWKCAEPTCDYASTGFATEKECDRHFNDKHDPDPKVYKCLFDGCTYTSKRDSNCKQHMEKTHSWEYLRSKSKKDQTIEIPMYRRSELKALAAAATPTSLNAPTPASSAADNHRTSSVATPTSTHLSYSPVPSSSTAISPPPPVANYAPTFGHSLMDDEFSDPYEDGQFDFPAFGNELGMARSGSLYDGAMLGTPSSTNDFMSTSTAPSDVIKDELGYLGPAAWPPTLEFFSGYNNPEQPIQQPTPAYSDHKDFDMVDMAMPSVGQEESQAYLSPAPDAHHDFSLFSGPSVGESSATGAALFPELVDNTSGHFDELMDPMFGASDGYSAADWLGNMPSQTQ